VDLTAIVSRVKEVHIGIETGCHPFRISRALDAITTIGVPLLYLGSGAFGGPPCQRGQRWQRRLSGGADGHCEETAHVLVVVAALVFGVVQKFGEVRGPVAGVRR